MGILSILAVNRPSHDIVLKEALPTLAQGISKGTMDAHCVGPTLRIIEVLLAPFKSTSVREQTISFMVYKLNIMKDMLPKLVLRKDLTPKARCDLIATCYCVVSAYVDMHKKFEDLKIIAKSKGSPPGNISTLKSEFPPRGSKELKILWRSQLLEHLFETWRDWSRVFHNNSVVSHGTILDTSSKLLRLVNIRTSSSKLHVRHPMTHWKKIHTNSLKYIFRYPFNMWVLWNF